MISPGWISTKSSRVSPETFRVSTARFVGGVLLAGVVAVLPGGCSTQTGSRGEPGACYQPLDCRTRECATVAEIVEEIERDARRVDERRGQWLAWMRKRRPDVSEEDARRAVQRNRGGWHGARNCGEYTLYSRSNGFTGETLYFDGSRRLIAARVTTDAGKGNPACQFWTHYGPEIDCSP